MRILKYLGLIAPAIAVLALTLSPAYAAPKGPPGFGQLYYEGDIVRTVIPPAAAPKAGLDNLYAVPDQLAVIAVAPGDKEYHGGKWAFHRVSWNVDAYLLTSEDDVLEAEAAGDVTITRVPEMDFKCPVQP